MKFCETSHDGSRMAARQNSSSHLGKRLTPTFTHIAGIPRKQPALFEQLCIYRVIVAPKFEYRVCQSIVLLIAKRVDCLSLSLSLSPCRISSRLKIVYAECNATTLLYMIFSVVFVETSEKNCILRVRSGTPVRNSTRDNGSYRQLRAIISPP